MAFPRREPSTAHREERIETMLVLHDDENVEPSTAHREERIETAPTT